MNSKIADGLLLVVAIIWGGGFPAVGLAIESGMGPAQLTALRFIVAAVGMVMIFFKVLKSIKKIDVIGGVLAGIFLFIGFSFQTIGMQYTTASKNAFITSTYVLLVPLLGIIFFKRRLTVTQWTGILLMVLGVSFLSLEKDFCMNIGDILTLICAIGFAVQIVITGLFSPRCNPYCFNTVQMATVAVLSFIYKKIRHHTIRIQKIIARNNTLVKTQHAASCCASYMTHTIHYISENDPSHLCFF